MTARGLNATATATRLIASNAKDDGIEGPAADAMLQIYRAMIAAAPTPGGESD